MRKQFAFICAAAIVCNTPLHILAQNATTDSSASIKADESVPAQLQDNEAVPSEAAYQSVVPPSKYLPSSLVSYEASSAVVETLPENTPVASNSVSDQFNGPVYFNQLTPIYSAIVASNPAAPENNNILEKNFSNVEPIRPYYSVPVAAKTLTINSQSASNAAYSHYVEPVFPIANNDASSRKYYNVPIAENKVSIKSFGAVNVHHPSYAIQNIQPSVEITPLPPVLIKYSVNHVVKTPKVQYFPAPRIENAVPVDANKVTIEAYNSVTAHPPPAPKFSPGPAQFDYASPFTPVAKPIPVPVIQASVVETDYPGVEQIAVKSRTVVQPVPVTVGDYAIRYNPKPIPRLHADTFIEKVYAPIGSTQAPVNPGKSYARAIVFSPASEVSRVAFNGLGTSYGW